MDQIKDSVPLMMFCGQYQAIVLYNSLGKNLGFQMLTKCVSDLFLPRQEHGRQRVEVCSSRGQACLHQRPGWQLRQPALPVLGEGGGLALLGRWSLIRNAFPLESLSWLFKFFFFFYNWHQCHHWWWDKQVYLSFLAPIRLVEMDPYWIRGGPGVKHCQRHNAPMVLSL